MRFTTWPVLPNVFIIFTAILLSGLSLTPAQAAHHAPPDVPLVPVPVSIVWITPQKGQIFSPGQESEITWYVSKRKDFGTEQGVMIGL